MGNLGMTEILMILVLALIIFGPRKLPELGRTLGQSLAHFRRASEDFKRQWEDEVDIEQYRLSIPPAPVEPASEAAQESAQQEENGGQEPNDQEPGELPYYEPEAAQPQQSELVAESEQVVEIEPSATAPTEQTVARETKQDWM